MKNLKIKTIFVLITIIGVALASDERPNLNKINIEQSISIRNINNYKMEDNDYSLEINTLQAISTDRKKIQTVLRGAKEANLYASIVSSVVLVIGEDGIGAGAIITKAGHVITNMHVVGNTNKVKVAFVPRNSSDKPKKEDIVTAEVIKVNEIKDLALLKIQNMPSYVSPIPLANTAVKVGDDVHAIGHPRGELWSYTKGYVSQIRKGYEWSASEKGVKHNATVIQTQTPINPGNSGGPLINDVRELVGINSFKDTANPGLNYAVDVLEVKEFLRQEKNIYAQRKSDERKCGKEPVETIESKNEIQGEIVVIRFDANCDGKIESELRLAKDKSKPHIFAMDTNGDGKFDVVVFDEDQDGKWDITYYDIDFDGKIDAFALNSDGKLIASGEIKPIKKG